jgi:hypothetical protein
MSSHDDDYNYDDDYYFDAREEARVLEERQLRGESLRFAKFFDVHLLSDTPEMSQAIDFLIPKLRGTRAASAGHESNLRRCLNTVLANLMVNYAVDPEKYTIYSRINEGYPKAERYNPLQVKWRGLKRVIDGLVELSFITSELGYHYQGSWQNMRSRMRAESDLIELLNDEFGLNNSHVQKVENPELVVLKDNNKLELDYPETSLTRSIRSHLEAYNAQLEEAEIGIDLTDDEIEEAHIHLNAKRNRRIFNNGSFEQGGRFSGPWWQLVPKENRKLILIDGETTVECDYQAQHVHILYSLAGENYYEVHGEGTDPHTIEGYNDEFRPLIKKASWAIMGSKSKKGAKTSIRNWIRDKDEFSSIDIGDVIEKFEQKHQTIQEFFYAKPALMLLYRDSLISQYIIERLMSEGIIVLDIHDSFIVQRRHEGLLCTVMSEAFGHYGFPTNVGITNNL